MDVVEQPDEVVWISNPRPSDLTDARLQALLGHWTRLKGDGDLPSSGAIDPLAMPFILGWLCLVDVVDGGADFVMRLCGAKLVEALMCEPTGLRASSPGSALADEVNAGAFRDVVVRRQPLASRHRPAIGAGVALLERLVLPLGANGQVTRLLIGAIPLVLASSRRRGSRMALFPRAEGMAVATNEPAAYQI